MIYTKKELEQHWRLNNENSHQVLWNISKCLKNGQNISLFEAKYFVEYLISRPIAQKDKILFFKIIDYILSYDNQFCNEYVLCTILIDLDNRCAQHFGYTEDDKKYLNNYPNINLLRENWAKTMKKEIPCLDFRQGLVQKEVALALKNIKKSSSFHKSDGTLDPNLYNKEESIKLALYYYFYVIIKLVFEEENTSDFIFTFNGHNIVYDETSLIHNLIRHYGGERSAYSNTLGYGDKYKTKSAHTNPKYQPRTLFNDLKKIYRLVEISGLMTGAPKPQLYFEDEGIKYQVLTNINNFGNYHIDTFHEIDKQELLDRIGLMTPKNIGTYIMFI